MKGIIEQIIREYKDQTDKAGEMTKREMTLIEICLNAAISKRPLFTLEEITEAIKAQWVKDFGKLMDDDSERDGYFICGFVHEALKSCANYRQQTGS